VTVKVLTGDNELVTARSAARWAWSRALLGPTSSAWTTSNCAAVESTTVFAKLTPLHKERIVRALRANGHVVGFMGDGINDAPALRAADIGISVDSGGGHRQGSGRHHPAGKSLMVLEKACSRAAAPSPTCSSTSA
jgi:Mg2+-importing ATPase